MPDQPTATLSTNRGDVVVTLFSDFSPKTVRNFIELAQGTKQWQDPRTRQAMTKPFFDGLTFHRVIANFMIQGGCPLGDGRGGPGYKFADEFSPGLVFDRPYLLAMANSGQNTNGSQFFVTVAPTPWLNRKHTIFGEVADAQSRAVIDAIGATPTGPGDVPLEPVVLEKVVINGLEA